ncbi:MAG TPA: DUF1932 domain-containing protein [Solirubrobacteraceae bacterium]|jgi:3-hydroxyisobutyrate dehydrogenase-like beta-hydroxyacid dehydrogenase|nr:DUF1932 domain-containing protein [Solirubrobacteraceae bacterium]
MIAFLGLGEAGGLISADLRAAGADVRGYDPLPETRPDAASPVEAASGAGVVISLVTAEHAVEAATSVLGAIGSGTVYADLNTASPRLKQELAALVGPTGAAFADVALMAPVPGLGLRTPAVASGPGARAFADALGPLGMPVTVIDGGPGVAAARKLLRSVAWKGLAAVVGEALEAARAAGQEAWMRAELLALLETADATLIERMETGSRKHAVRRMHEMEDVSALLRELGVQPRVSEASREWLASLRA